MALSNTAIPLEYGAFRDAVLAGEIPVNKEVSLEMNRIDRLIDSPEYYYDDSAIEGFIEFCETEMTLTDGSDVRLLPTFKLWAECLLAWFYFTDEVRYNPELRRYETITVKRRLVNKQYLIVGRGAAKSMYAAFLQAYFLTIDPETTYQIVTAPTKVQAEETMSPIRTAISRARGPLFKFLTDGNIKSNTWSKQKLASTKKGIENFVTNSLLEIRAMSIAKLQGARPKHSTVDEWLSGDIREDVIAALEQGASKIKSYDWTILATSSEGTARDGVGDSIKMELQSILNGEYDDPHTSIWMYRLDSLDEVNQPEMWLKANPNLGATISYEAYQRDVLKAEKSPSSRNDMLAKRFGIPVEGQTYFFVYEETIPHNHVSFDDMECSLGADFSQGDDFCAFDFLFPLGDGRFGVKTRSYVVDSKVKKLPSAMQIKYQSMAKEGTLVILDGAILDEDEVIDDLFDFINEHGYTINAFGFDPYNAEHYKQRYIEEYGAYNLEVVRQGVRTESVPLGEIKKLAENRMLIFDEELMSFSMGNSIAIEDNNGGLKLSKKRAAEKIDNVAALIDAWVAYKRNQEVFM